MKYIIVAENTIYSSMFKVLYNDVLKKRNAIFLSNYLDEKNEIRRLLFKALYKEKINRYLKNSFEFFLRPKFSLVEEISKLENQDICVIFNNASVNKYYNEYTLKKIKRLFPNIKLVLYFVDPIFQVSESMAVRLAKKNMFNLVYTYSKTDAQKYDFIYHPTPYSKIVDEVPHKIINGVYFIGSEKGRTPLLKQFANKFLKLGIDYRFDVTGDPQNSNKYFSVVENEKGIKEYPQVLNTTLRYNCILDLVQEKAQLDESGLSLRVYEALIYNKVLITNNPAIKKFEYYVPTTMHYVKDKDEIQKSWINSKVDNHYDGQLSPLNLIRDIEQRLK